MLVKEMGRKEEGKGREGEGRASPPVFWRRTPSWLGGAGESRGEQCIRHDIMHVPVAGLLCCQRCSVYVCLEQSF